MDLIGYGINFIKHIALLLNFKQFQLRTSESLCSRKISAILTPKLIRITRLKLGRDVLRPARTGPF